ncbi:MAG: dienelactone hydrolase family protein [Candidatus Hydrogenedentes bacterium]|nr:dienelactone hydrolase family protein [Candidatus Hydrogenedentota bacterium]
MPVVVRAARYTRFALLAALLAWTTPAAADTEAGGKDPMQTGFLQQTIEVHGKAHRYVLFVPEAYTPESEWPLIVFLHGAGERGDDGLVHSKVGLGPAIEKHPDRFPALVLMPQCPKDANWDTQHDVLEAQMAAVRAAYAVDDKRVYLTGLSMGGYGTWLWGAIHTDTFAALVPICGGGDPADIQRLLGTTGGNPYGSHASRVRALAAVPIWAFHGGADTVVPPDRSRAMVEAVQGAGGNIRYTEYEGVGHNSWDATYRDHDVISWLLAQGKS